MPEPLPHHEASSVKAVPPPLLTAVTAKVAAAASLMGPPPAQPSFSTIAMRTRIEMSKAKSSMANKAAANSAGLARSRLTMAQDLPAQAVSSNSFQQGVSVDMVAQLMQSMNANRPTELALQNNIRRLNTEVGSLQAQLRQAEDKADAAAKTAAKAVQTIKEITLANTVLKRGSMLKDMITVYHDYVKADMVAGSEERTSQITRLTRDTATTTDLALTTGVDCEMVSKGEMAPMEPMNCNDKDTEWLLECLQEDVNTMSAIEPWI